MHSYHNVAELRLIRGTFVDRNSLNDVCFFFSRDANKTRSQPSSSGWWISPCQARQRAWPESNKRSKSAAPALTPKLRQKE
jgi:hypothetical protein